MSNFDTSDNVRKTFLPSLNGQKQKSGSLSTPNRFSLKPEDRILPINLNPNYDLSNTPDILPNTLTNEAIRHLDNQIEQEALRIEAATIANRPRVF